MEWPPDKIQEAREARGWSQRQLADALDSSLRSVSAWEAGETRPSRRYQRALTELFAAPEDATPSRPLPPRVPDATNTQLLTELMSRLDQHDQVRQMLRRGDPVELDKRGGIIDGTPHPKRRPGNARS